MATGTLGTNATTSLVSITWGPMTPVADLAAIAETILGQGSGRSISPGAFSASGRLKFPGREGFVLLKPGDAIGIDSFGWPVIVSKESLAYVSSSWSLV